MLFKQIMTISVLLLSAAIATPVPEPAPIDAGLQRVVAQKNGMGGAGSNSTRLTTNGALPSSQRVTILAAVSLPAIAAGAASLL